MILRLVRRRAPAFDAWRQKEPDDLQLGYIHIDVPGVIALCRNVIFPRNFILITYRTNCGASARFADVGIPLRSIPEDADTCAPVPAPRRPSGSAQTGGVGFRAEAP